MYLTKYILPATIYWKRKIIMTRLNDMIDNHTVMRWSEDEIADWVEKLPTAKKDLFLGCLKKMRAGGYDVHEAACTIRARVEPLEQKSRMSMIDFLASASEGWFLGGVISGTRKISVE